MSVHGCQRLVGAPLRRFAAALPSEAVSAGRRRLAAAAMTIGPAPPSVETRPRHEVSAGRDDTAEGNASKYRRFASAAAVAAAAGAAVAVGAGVAGASELRCDTAGIHPPPPGKDRFLHNEYVKSQEHLLEPTAANPTPTTVPPPIAGLAAHHLRRRHVACFIGLPLRGKAFFARRLANYLEFVHGATVKLIDLNNYLEPGGSERLLEDIRAFFEDDLPQAGGRSGSLEQKHVDSGGFVILYPSDTNAAMLNMWSATSKRRRRWMKETLEAIRAHCIFVEIQVDDSSTHRRGYMERLEKSRGVEPGSLLKQCQRYKQLYVTIQDDDSEDDLAYMKLVNYNHKVVANNMMRSFLGAKIAHFLSSVHPYPRTIYLTRHGESIYNVEKKIGGDSSLSLAGQEYGKRLGAFSDLVVCNGASDISFACVDCSSDTTRQLLRNGRLVEAPGGRIVAGPGWADVSEGMRLAKIQVGCDEFEASPETVEGVLVAVGEGTACLCFVREKTNADDAEQRTECARLWTSSLRRTRETASYIRHPVIEMERGRTWEQLSPRVYRNLDEVYAGEFEGLTYEEIKERMPMEAELRKIDKLGYRYPRGESYYDLIARLDSPIHQMENIEGPLLVVSHQAVLRLVYSYLRGIRREDATELDIPLHTVIRIRFDGTGAMEETRYRLGPSPCKRGDGQRRF